MPTVSLGQPLPDELETLSAHQLTPRSSTACLMLGVLPAELLRSYVDRKLAQLPAELVKTDRKLHAKTKEHLEQKRRDTLDLVLTKRAELIEQSAAAQEIGPGFTSPSLSHSDSTASASASAAADHDGARSEAGSLRSSTSTNFLELKMLQMRKAEERRAQQFAEKQKRDLAMLLSSELKTISMEHDAKRLDEELQRKREAQRQVNEQRAAAFREKQRRADEFQQQQLRAMDDHALEIERRDQEEREKVRLRKAEAERQIRELGRRRDRERRERLEQLRREEEEQAELARRAMQERMLEADIRSVARRVGSGNGGVIRPETNGNSSAASLLLQRTVQSSASSASLSPTAYGGNSVSPSAPRGSANGGGGRSRNSALDDQVLSDSQKIAQAQERLTRFQAECDAEMRERRRKLAERDEKTRRAKEAFEQQMEQKDMQVKQRDEELERRRQEKALRLRAEQEYYREKDKQRLEVKVTAEQLKEEEQEMRRRRVEQKMAEVQERRRRMEEDAKVRHAAQAHSARLLELDRLEQLARLERQSEFKHNQMIERMHQVTERLDMVAREHEASLRKQEQARVHAMRQKDAMLKDFQKMRAKLTGDIGHDSDPSNIDFDKFGLPKDLVESVKGMTSGGGGGKSSSHSTTESPRHQHHPPQQRLARSKSHTQSSSRSTTHILKSAAKSSGGDLHGGGGGTPGQQTMLHLSSALTQQPPLSSLAQSVMPAATSTSNGGGSSDYRDRPTSLDMGDPANGYSAASKALIIETLASEQNGYMLQLLEKEQQHERERERMMDGVTDDIERKRLEKIFGVERAKAHEMIKAINREHELTLALKMKELGMLTDADEREAEERIARARAAAAATASSSTTRSPSSSSSSNEGQEQVPPRPPHSNSASAAPPPHPRSASASSTPAASLARKKSASRESREIASKEVFTL